MELWAILKYIEQDVKSMFFISKCLNIVEIYEIGLKASTGSIIDYDDWRKNYKTFFIRICLRYLTKGSRKYLHERIQDDYWRNTIKKQRARKKKLTESGWSFLNVCDVITLVDKRQRMWAQNGSFPDSLCN